MKKIVVAFTLLLLFIYVLPIAVFAQAAPVIGTPITSNHSNMGLWLVVAIIAAAGALILVVAKIKRP